MFFCIPETATLHCALHGRVAVATDYYSPLCIAFAGCHCGYSASVIIANNRFHIPSISLDRANPVCLQGFAFITFDTSEALQNALKLNGHEVGGQALSVALAHQEVPDGQTEAFVLNLPPTADSAAVEALLAVCGPVKSLRLPLDRETSQPRVPSPLPCFLHDP